MAAKIERKLLSTFISLALASAVPAYAQQSDNNEAENDNESDQLEEVVVKGIRSSIRNSIEEKRLESSIIEAVSAEDIGKLPDVSIADSIARLPGLTAQRLRGRAQVISVRGLGPDFTTALLNGRLQVSAGDNRGVEFDQYPAELLSQAVVYKTPDASLIGQAIGGTVDLRTIRPLKYGRRAATFVAQYEVNDQGDLNSGSDDTGHRLTASYIDQFNNDKVGIAIGIATQSSPTQSERWDAWGYPDINGDLVLGGAKPYVESRELERDALIGTLEFAPTDSLRLTGDVFYSDFKDGGILRGIELPLQWGGATLQDGFNVNNGLITDGTFDGVQGVVRNDLRARDAELTAFGVNAEWIPNDQWRFVADLSTSDAERKDVDFESYSGTGAGFGTGASDALGFSIGEGGSFTFDPSLDYSDPNLFLLTDPQGWGQVGFIKEPQTNDELDQIRFEAERIVGGSFVDTIQFGVNHTSRDKDKTSIEAFVDLANPGENNTTAIPPELLLAPTELAFLGIPGQVSYDPLALAAAGLYSFRPNTNADVLTKAWDVNEDETTAFLQFNVRTEWGSVPVRGNIGFQYLDVEQESTGPSITSEGVGRFTDGDEYSYFLPSANFTFEMTETTYLRLSAARTVMRPRMDDMRASREVNLNTSICTFVDGVPTLGGTAHDPLDNQSCLTVDGGNPQLRPYEANSFDVSVERYFRDEISNIAVALFYKDIEQWVFNGSGLTDTSEAISAIFGPEFLAANPTLGTGVLNSPVNTEGGSIQGIEFSTNLSGGLFTPALENFGLYVSYAYNDSEITPEGSEPIEIPGFSKDIINASVYFENDNWQARVSMRDRSDFLGEVTGFGANRDFRDVEGENVIDAQFGYTFTEGALAGSSIILQAYNVTDQEFQTFLNDDPRQVKDWQRYGTSYLLGFTYTF